jgi:hypothetical protein
MCEGSSWSRSALTGAHYGSRIGSLGNQRRKSAEFRVMSPCRFVAKPPIKTSATGCFGTLSVRRVSTWAFHAECLFFTAGGTRIASSPASGTGVNGRGRRKGAPRILQ